MTVSWGGESQSRLTPRAHRALLALLFLVAFLIGFGAPWHLLPWSAERQAAQVEEDESGWDCATMGNHLCGDGR